MKLDEKHLEVLAIHVFCNLEHQDDCEYGSIGTDCKRPFGNSDVEGDILEIIGVKPLGNDGDDACWSRDQREYAAELYKAVPDFIRKKYVPEIPKRYS